MSETIETLANRLDRLEAAMQQMSDQLSRLTTQQNPPEKPKTGVELIKEMAIDKRPLAEGFRKLMDRMGISGEPIPAEELQARMARDGIRPEDNEFSRAIIAEREK